jgi:hypothetical protein
MKMLPSFGFILSCLILGGCQKQMEISQGTIRVSFENLIGSQPLELNNQSYLNPFNETYTVSKFRYYISNVQLKGPSGTAANVNGYYLVDAAIPASKSFEFITEEQSFTSIEFLVGVDSVRNISGAQTGALDPLNDMFWTWNSGYVMLKLEGNSPQSNRSGQKIEYHIGGFSGTNSVLKTISLDFPAGKNANIRKGQTCEIKVSVDVNAFWQQAVDVRIAGLPVCTTPGITAKNISGNYQNMFLLKDVINQ